MFTMAKDGYDAKSIANVIQEMSDKTYDEIAHNLNKRGLTTKSGKPWTVQNVGNFRITKMGLEPRVKLGKRKKSKRLQKPKASTMTKSKTNIVSIVKKMVETGAFTDEELAFIMAMA